MTELQAQHLLNQWCNNGSTLQNLPRFEQSAGAVALYLPDPITNTYLLYGRFSNFKEAYSAYGELLDKLP